MAKVPVRASVVCLLALLAGPGCGSGREAVRTGPDGRPEGFLGSTFLDVFQGLSDSYRFGKGTGNE